MMVYRSSQHDRTKLTPNMLMLGREVGLPLDVVVDPKLPVRSPSPPHLVPEGDLRTPHPQLELCEHMDCLADIETTASHHHPIVVYPCCFKLLVINLFLPCFFPVALK